MLKRVALFVIGLMVAVGALLLYEYFSGASINGNRVESDAGPTAAPRGDQPFEYEGRRPENADLEYVLTAKKFKQATKEDGTPIPGEFLLTEPSARYYTTDGRLVTIRSDSGVVFVDTVASGPGGTRTKFMPRGGRLSGHVLLTFGPQDADTNPASAASTIKVKLSKDLEFDNVARTLHSAGDINVRSNQVAFDGSDVTIAFNPDQKRLEFFRINQGNKIILHDVDPQTLALSDMTAPGAGGKGNAATARTTAPAAAAVTTAPATAPGQAVASATQPASGGKASSVPTTYKLAFGQNVEATVGQGKLSSEQLFVLFMAAPADVEKAKPQAVTEPGTAGGAASGAGNATGGGGATAGAATQDAALTGTTLPAATEPLPKANSTDLVITWTGPMEMRPTGPEDMKLAGPKDKALEAVGTAEHPVVVQDGTITVTGGRLWVHAAERRLEIEPGDVGQVRMADATRGSGTCQGISFDRAANHLRLAGPGVVDVPQTLLRKSATATGRPLEISWKTALDLDLIDIPDPKKPGKKSTEPAVRRAILTGLAKIDDPTFQLAGDTIDALIANTADPINPQTLEHLLATGNVTVKSSRGAGRGAKNVQAAAEPDGISGQRLELLTAVPDDGRSKAPVPTRLLVDGDVTAWSYRTEKETKDAGETASSKQKERGKETIYGQHLDIALASKPKNSGAAGGGGEEMAGGVGLGDYQAVAFTADGGNTDRGVKIELENYAAHVITATAHVLHATPLDNRATLEGVSGNPARVSFAEDAISGDRILLDQNKKTFEIPGAGEFLFTLPASKARKEAAPMRVTWTDRMVFDSDALLATFDGHTVSRMLSVKTADTSQLTADHLRVRLKHVKPVDAAATAPGDSELANLAGSSDLTLDTIDAEGRVVATGSQTGPGGVLLTQMLLMTEKLTYADETHQLTIPVPGRMVLIDNRPEKEKTGGAGATGGVTGGSARGQTAFEWAGKLVYNQQDNTVELTKDVWMVHVPAKAIRVSGAAATSRVDLRTQHLVAKLSAARDVGETTDLASPVGVGAGGNQRLESVRADGGATLTLDNKQECRADALTYDDNTHLATATSATREGGTYIDPEKQQLLHFSSLQWNMHDNAVTTSNLGGNIQLSPP
ncbi:MAG TPA: hypothetical protein VHQ47_12895 [Phycisphaerae bacterium]|nr:hypothetical protein [Phycisphaerae bacterium]